MQPHIPVPILIFVIVSIKMSILKFIKYYSKCTRMHQQAPFKKFPGGGPPDPPLWVRPDHFIFASSGSDNYSLQKMHIINITIIITCNVKGLARKSIKTKIIIITY